jgi:hypothetical protein
MRIGLIARMDRTGLGYQTKALFDMLKPVKTLVVNSAPFNGTEQIPEWYQPGDPNRFTAYSNGFPDDNAIDWFLYDLDIVITCEVPYHPKLYAKARERGIKVILQPNAELNPHFKDRQLDKPDYFFLPSTWYEEETRGLGVRTVVCPPPITLKGSQKEVKKEIGIVKVLHIAGKRAFADRNGTQIVERTLSGIPGVELTIRDQGTEDLKDNAALYKGEYHIMVLPRRYGGLCMPMHEALSQGMPVIMPDIKPNNSILPKEWLAKTNGMRAIMTKRRVNAYVTDPLELKDRVVRFRAMDQEAYNEERHKAFSIFTDYQASLANWERYLRQIMEGTL